MQTPRHTQPSKETPETRQTATHTETGGLVVPVAAKIKKNKKINHKSKNGATTQRQGSCASDQNQLSRWKPIIKATKQTITQGRSPATTLAPGVWQTTIRPGRCANQEFKNSFGVLTLSTIIVAMYSRWPTNRGLFFFCRAGGFFVRPLIFSSAGEW